MLNGPWEIIAEKIDWRGVALYRAKQAATGRNYLLEDLALATAFKERLYREIVEGLAKELARVGDVAHPAIRRPLDITRHEDRYLLVREDDQALWEGWAETPPVPGGPEEFGTWFTAMAEVLAAYHRAGLTARGVARADLVPAAGGVLVCDPVVQAYLAEYRDRERSQRWALAPEVSRGQPWSERSDLFALGLNAYLLAAGRFPFSGSGAILYDNLLAEAVADPRAFAPSLGAGPARLIVDLLNRDPGRRPAAPELAAALAAQREAGGFAAGEAERAAYARAGRKRALALARRERLRGFARRHRVPLLIGAGAILAIVLLSLVGNRPAPPAITSKTSPGQVVTAFYRAIDTLDQTLLEETLAPRTGGDIRNMVMTIFVIDRMNVAYGGKPLGAKSPLRVRDLRLSRVRREPPTYEALYDLTLRRGTGEEATLEITSMRDRLVLGRVKNRRVGEKWVIVGLDRKELAKRTAKAPPEEETAAGAPASPGSGTP